MEFQAKRIKFSFKKSSRERLFTQLQEANDRMRNLLESSDQISAARKQQGAAKSSSIVNRKINDFWRHAKRLHEALSKAWICNCASHVANLQLQHRNCNEIEFDILFDLKSAHGGPHWRDTKIKMVAAAQPTRCSAVTINLPRLTVVPPSVSRQVRLIDPRNQPIDFNTETSVIRDLCTTLLGKGHDCFGFLDEDEHRFIVLPGPRTSGTSDSSIISLAKLLQDDHPLTCRKRYFLALTLASSILQLGSTPWISTPLDKESIVFFQDGVNFDDSSLQSPYI